MNLTIMPNLYNRTQFKQNSAQKSKSVDFGNASTPLRKLTSEENVLYKKLVRASKHAFTKVRNLTVSDATSKFSEPVYKLQSKASPDVVAYCHTSKFAKPMLLVNADGESHIIHYAIGGATNQVSKDARREWVTKALKALTSAY